MAAIGKEIEAYLKTVATITSIVGTGDEAKIYQQVIKQNAVAPFIVIRTFRGTSEESLVGGPVGMASNRLQIDCYQVTPEAAYTLAELVRIALQGKNHITLDSVFCHSISSASSYRDGLDRPQKGAQLGTSKRWWFSRDYQVTYAEAVS